MCTADRSTEFHLRDGGSDHAPPPNWPDWLTTASAQARLPALPFPPQEVFLPGEEKHLHLFEAKNLSLLTSAQHEYDNHFAHILIDARRRAMAAFGTLVQISSFEPLDVGVHVCIHAVGRLKTDCLYPSAPFARADVTPVRDTRAGVEELSCLLKRFWPAFSDVVAMAQALGEPVVRRKVDTSAVTIAAVERAKRGHHLPASDLLADVLPGSAHGVQQVAHPLAHYTRLLTASAQRMHPSGGPAVLDVRDLRVVQGDDNVVLHNGYALSFAAWDFFPSDAQSRQRAIEQLCTEHRLRVVVDALELRRKQLSARMAVRSALSE